MLPLVFAWLLLLALLLRPGRVAALRPAPLRMIRAHWRIVLSLHHPVLSMGRSRVPGWFAGVRFAVRSRKVLLPMKILGRVFVPVLSSAGCSCRSRAMFSCLAGFVFNFPRSSSCCGSANSLYAFAGRVSLIK